MNAIHQCQGECGQAVGSASRHPRAAASETGRWKNLGGLALGGPAGEEVDVIKIDSLAMRVCAYEDLHVEGNGMGGGDRRRVDDRAPATAL